MGSASGRVLPLTHACRTAITAGSASAAAAFPSAALPADILYGSRLRACLENAKSACLLNGLACLYVVKLQIHSMPLPAAHVP